MTAGMSTKRWLAHYDSDVPQTIGHYPEKTLLDYLAELARDRADQVTERGQVTAGLRGENVGTLIRAS